MNKKWQINKAPQEQIEMLQNKYSINKLLAIILANRGIVEEEQIEKFLSPKRSDFYDPFGMPDMEITVNRIIKAINNQEKTIIYGDYDVDGITSVTVLKSFLEERGLNVGVYIPNRLEEGYGLNRAAVEKIAEEGYTLMITVDCGISAIEEVKYASELGIETLITDHHEPGSELPKALAVVDAKRKDNKYECRNLAGVGVVFKLIQAISIRLGLEEREYLKYLDIVCLGTISDIVPLTDENRVIVKLGLKLVQQTRNLGLKSILQSIGYNNIDSTAISFGIAPRINACGRMGHQEDALNLFLSKESRQVYELTQKLNEYNKERQEIEKNIFADAVQQIERDGLDKKDTIVVMGKNWHHGVIGIVASKITEMYFKPSILLCEEDGLGKGSGRSIPGFDLYETLTECSETIERFGGHAMAIGITINSNKFEEFRNKFEKIAKEKKIEEIVPILKIDSQISLDEINREMVESLKELEPFGEENKTPLFLFKNLKIDSIRALTEGKHLKLTVKENKNIVNAIGFNIGELANEYRIGDKINLVGSLEINSFNGVDNIQINIKDIMHGWDRFLTVQCTAKNRSQRCSFEKGGNAMKTNYTIKDIIDKAKKNKRWADTKLIQRAYNYAVQKHGDQKRKSGEPYIIHPTNVAYTIAELGLDEPTICAALLHDVVEDTDATNEDIKREFGEEIAEMVDGVTKLKLIQHASIEENQVENYRKMFLAMGKDIRVIIIKLADRLHNMRTLEFLKRERQIAISKETMQLYAPLANRLGLYSMKWELEDLAFKYLYPEEYGELIKGIEQKREQRLKFIEKIMQDIRVQLKKQHIEAEVTGRAKHLYSIYRKMQRDSKTLDQIYDLFALRIIVNSVKDCYAALGVVHEMYTPMPGRFKDYIAVPKANMYQSIHTTLLGEKGTPFEVQIRTWDMHRIAEYGIAAHWAYKEANYGSKKGHQNVKVQDDKLAWLRESLEWQQEMQDPQQFLETLKTELFEDEVYVFTPKGAIKVLPKGATPIDFAYCIHAEIGNHMTGAKINSKMVPIITPIRNGDIVEILTSDNSKGPSMDWLKFVKSTSARNKIMSWFKKEKKEENIEKGKASIEREIKRIGMAYGDMFKTEYINPMLDRYKYKNLDEMYAAVGFGAITAQKIIARMLIEYRKEHKEEPIEEKIEELSTARKNPPRPSDSGIIVKGIDNCLVKLSKCCNPLPGDEIIGYITKGRGVSVHRKDCVNVNELLKEENRIIDVKWYDQEKVTYTVEIEVFANDRNGLLADIIKKINDAKAKILGVNARATKERIAITEVTLEVDNLDGLNKIIRELRKVDSVYDVKRKK